MIALWHRFVLRHHQTLTYYRIYGDSVLVCSCERVWAR